MRVFKIVAGLSLVAVFAALAWFFYSLAAPPRAGHLDSLAVSRIRAACRFQALCTVRLGDIFDGEWDTFYEFGVDVPQSGIDHTLGPARIRKRDAQRLLVFTRSGSIVSSEREPSGSESPLDGEVEFGEEHHREDKIFTLTPNSRLQVDAFPITDSSGHAGTFYVLRPSATLP